MENHRVYNAGSYYQTCVKAHDHGPSVSYSNAAFIHSHLTTTTITTLSRKPHSLAIELLSLCISLPLLPSLMPKQWAHSLKDTCLSLSASHSWKKREVQCSMGTNGTLRGASSEWDRNLDRNTSVIFISLCNGKRFETFWNRKLK